LIEYLYADKEYKAVYENYLQDVSESIFTVDKMESLYDTYAELLRPYALKEQD
jgi:spore coat protein H